MWAAERIVVSRLKAIVGREIDPVALPQPAILATDGVAHDFHPPREPPQFRILEILIALVTGRAGDMLRELREGRLAVVAREPDVQVGQHQNQERGTKDRVDGPGAAAPWSRCECGE